MTNRRPVFLLLSILLLVGACREVERVEKRWVKVAVGDAVQFGYLLTEVRACALAEDGEVRCFGCEYWSGDDWLGQSAPCMPPPGEFVDLAVGEGRTCGVREDGETLCWGFEPWGEPAHRLSPGDRLVSVATGPTHNCGLDADGRAVCWGCDPTYDPDVDQRLGCGVWEGPFVQVVPVQSATCALDEEGDLRCWGYYGGPLIGSGAGFVSFDMVTQHGCAVTDRETLVCWGWETEVPSGRFTHVAVSDDAGCAVTTLGGIRCWGEGPIVEEAPLAGTYERLDLSETTACAITTDGGVECWGITSPTLREGPEPELRCR